MTSDAAPLNPEVLKWARESQGMDIADVAKALKKDTAEIIAWESGESAPTYVQLEKLADSVFNRPIALFFFPAPPTEKTPRQSFRTLPEEEIIHLPPSLRTFIRKGRVMQLNLSEIHGGKNPATNNLLRELNFDPSTSATEMANAVRRFMNIDIDSQRAWGNVDTAFKNWRDSLEAHGVAVFKGPFKDERFSGFCLYDIDFPIIYVNNTKSTSRQIFTLFHELAHLLMETGGIDSLEDSYISQLHGADHAIEVLCNRFANAFLVPDIDFTEASKGLAPSNEHVQELSKRYHVSREVILRKFRDRNAISQEDYAARVAEWNREYAKKKKGGGGNYYLNIRTYLGKSYLESAFGSYYQQRISIETLADYLDVNVKSVPGMESTLYEGTKGH